MPGSGSLIIRPIEAHFLDCDDSFDHLSSYCDLHFGSKRLQTEICKNGGSNPYWHHPLVMPITDEHAKCTLEVMGEQRMTEEKELAGRCDIDLEEIKKEGNVRKWFTLTKDGHNEGDILIEASFLAELPPFFGTKSTPSAQSSSTTQQRAERLSSEAVEKKSVRKFSDNRQDRPGRGWNMYVPGEDLDPNFDDLGLKKTRSAMPDMQGEFADVKVERRRSFWEKILNV